MRRLGQHLQTMPFGNGFNFYDWSVWHTFILN
jgi:hypothetical protein